MEQYLQLRKVKKHNVHTLLPRHVAQRRKFCKILHEIYLAGNVWKCIVTLDEAWIYLNGYNKKGLFIMENEEKKLY